MKTLKRLFICIIGIFIIGLIWNKSCYGITVTAENAFDTRMSQMIGQYIDQNGEWTQKGWNSCSQANQDKGYSSRIVTMFETIYNKSKGRIVANSVGIEDGAQTYLKSDDEAIRLLAGAMATNLNITGVRWELMQCINSNLLTRSKTVTDNNKSDGTEWSGSSDAWRAANKEIMEQYRDYQAIRNQANGHSKKAENVTQSGKDYVLIGPFRMIYGSNPVIDVKINGKSILREDKTTPNSIRYQYEGLKKNEKTGKMENATLVSNNINKLKPGSKTQFVLSGIDIYIRVTPEKFAELVENKTKFSVSVTQGEFTYTRGRAIVCNNGNSIDQGNVWYVQKSHTVPQKTITYTVKDNTDNSGSVVVVKKNSKTNKAIQGVQIALYGKVGTTSGWVAEGGNLTNNSDEANILTTGTDGKVTFADLEKGDYYVYEIEVPSGYDLEDQRANYPDSSDPNKFAGKDAYDNCVYLGKVTSNYNTVTLEKTQDPLGKLTVQKVITVKKNGKNEEQGVSNIGLKIYGKTSIGEGWVTSDGSLRPYIDQGRTYKTGTDGKVTASNLRKGTYYVYEVSVPEPYHLDDQIIDTYYPNSNDPNGFAGKLNNGDCVYLGSKDASGSTVSAQFKQKKPVPKTLTIVKKDKEKNTAIKGAGFKVMIELKRYLVQSGTRYEKDTFVWLKQDGSVTNKVSEAYEFKTGSDGKVTISNIYARGKACVYEVTMPDGYLPEDQNGYKEGQPSAYKGTFLTGQWVYVGYTNIERYNNNNPTTVTAYNQKTRGNLQITKTDTSYKSEFPTSADYVLQGAKMKIYGEAQDGTKGWAKASTTASGEVKYDLGSYKDATEFTTNSNGQVFVQNLKFGTYYIYETRAPEGYDIKEQDGYKNASSGSTEITDTHWVFLGSQSVVYNTSGNTSYISVSNKKYTGVKGKVWVDMPGGKDATRDYLYKVSSEDTVLSGIKVNLRNLKNNNQIVGTATTDANGEYEIKTSDGRKLSYWSLSHCYVEFEYDNTKYVTVIPFKDGTSMINYNSKAQEEEITEDELYDSRLTGTTGAHPGRAVTYKGMDLNSISKDTINSNNSAKIEERWLTAYYNNTTCKVENINIGFMPKVDPDHNVAETIEYVKLVKGNYTFTYKYGDEAVTEEGDKQSTVALGNVNTATFTQGLYPSDIKYNIANGLNGNDNNAYKVYVVYKVTVYNNTNITAEYLHNEKTLNLESLTNTYDTSKYELSKDVLTGDNPVYTNDFKNWTNSGDTATYNLQDTNKKFKDGLKGGEKETAYIQFKVRDQALRLVLDGDLNIATTVKAKGYHTYTRKDQNWKEKDKTYTHRSVDKEKANSALSIKLTLFDTRTISGTVFEDTKDSSRDKERIGNGRYDQSEKTITEENSASSNKYSVIVSLINAETTFGEAAGEVTSLYEDDLVQNPASGKWTRCKQKAVTRVDANGNYSFKGVVPGNYYIRFTYGDGRTETRDQSGNIVTDATVATKINGQSNVINSNYYKSTIETGPVLSATTDNRWYLGVMGQGTYSVATDTIGTYFDESGNAKEQNIDIVNARVNSTKEINNTTSKYKVVINAESPKMDIAFEYVTGSEYQVTNNQLRNLKSNCTGMGFGIIERPHVDIQLEETIQNVKLTLSNGTNLINGNPADQNVSEYLTSIGNGAQAKIETDESNLYGSSVTVTYKITAINNSEIEYRSGLYYKYGIRDGNVISTEIKKMVNYVSYKKCNFITPDSSDNLTFTDNYGEEYTKEKYYTDDVKGVNYNENDYKSQLLNANTNSITPKAAGEAGSKVDFTLRVSKLIPSSNSNENLGWDNYTELIAITNESFTPQYTSHFGSFIINRSNTSEPDNSQATITLTPPTGKDKSYTVYIIIAGALIIVAGGVVLIKKFVI